MNRGVKTALLTVIVFGGLYVSLGPLRFPEYLLSKGSATVRVASLRDIPKECNSSLLNRHRSSVPGHMSMGYCGSIMTDHGSFQLPENRMYFFGQSRSDILGKLKVGCTFDVVYYGYNAAVYEGVLQTNRYIPKLVSVDGPTMNCT